VLGILAAVDIVFYELANGYVWQRNFSASVPQLFSFAAVILIVLLLLRRLVGASFADTGYQMDDNYLMIKSAFLGQRTYIVPLEKIQAVIFKRTIFQIRRGLATVELDINGILRPVRLYNIRLGVAEELRGIAVRVVNANNI